MFIWFILKCAEKKQVLYWCTFSDEGFLVYMQENPAWFHSLSSKEQLSSMLRIGTKNSSHDKHPQV